MSRLPRLGVFALALSAWLLGACVSGGDSDDPEATATTEVTPSATSAVATSEPTGTSTPIVVPTARPDITPVPRRNGVMLLDASGAGEHYTLYDGTSRVLVGDSPAPRFAADGSVWLRASEWTGAIQFSLDGATELSAIEDGWGVSTVVDGSRIAFYRGDEPTASELVIEFDGGTLVVPGLITKHEFSPDGTRVAYYRGDAAGVDTLHVIDLETGETTMLASSIERCQCESTAGPVWSPSGRTLAYVDYGRLLGVTDPTRGQYVVPAGGGDPIDVGTFAGWLPGVGADQAAIVRDGDVLRFDAATGESRILMSAPEGRSIEARVLPGRALLEVRLTESSTADTVTVLLDALTGDELARWELWGVATLTPDGPAVFPLGGQNQRAGAPFCNGLAVVHAALTEPACVEHADFGIWSPDGTRLMVHGNSRASSDDWVGVWSAHAGLEYRFDVPPHTSLADWTPDGGRILVAWGFGP